MFWPMTQDLPGLFVQQAGPVEISPIISIREEVIPQFMGDKYCRELRGIPTIAIMIIV
jgi:hypothetical protein